MSSSKTVVSISEPSRVSVGVSAEGQLWVRFGTDDEHQAEIVGSAWDMLSMASHVVGRAAGYVSELERRLGDV